MVTDQAGVKTCMGYSKFVQARHEDLVQWLEPVERDLLSLAAGLSDGSRLRDIQHQLCELIRALDPEKIRYPEPDLQLA
jgi:hypothetical protein